MDNEHLVKLFTDLVQIPSPSGNEKAVVMFIQKYLSKYGITSTVDQSANKNNSNTGNLIVKLQGKANLPVILFVAHMDTVETGEKPIKPKIKNGLITSDGTTILGVDDKASVASLIQSLIFIKTWEKHPTIIVAFTTSEEKGKMGSSFLNLSEKIDYCFNFDGSSSLGSFIYQTLGEVPFEIKLIGKAAHAAVEPEKGINAIKTAAELIIKLPIGKNSKGMVLNIGKIEGGKANNIIPDKVILYGQVRAYLQKDLDELLLKVESKIKKACLKSGCMYEFTKKQEEGAPPAYMEKNSKIIQIAKKATEALGLKFSLDKGPYTSDANFLSSKYKTLDVSRGGKMQHSFNESITVENLQTLKNLTIELIKQAMNN